MHRESSLSRDSESNPGYFCSCSSNSREDPFLETQGVSTAYRCWPLKQSRKVTKSPISFLDPKRRTISLHTSVSGFHSAQFLVQPHAHPTSAESSQGPEAFLGELLPRSPTHFQTLIPEQTESNVFTTDQ